MVAAVTELECSLATEPVEDPWRKLGDGGVGREDRKPLERVDARGDETTAVGAGDVRDERKMVVRAAPVHAERPPGADAAVVDWLRVGLDGRRARFDPGREASLRGAVVGGVVREVLDVRCAVARDDGDRLGRDPLDLFEEIAVDAHLDDGGRLDPLRELRVGDVVRVIAEHRRPVVATDQEVRVATPAPVEEGCLEDHVGARVHRRHGLVVGGAQVRRGCRHAARHLDDRVAGCFELGDVATLVLVAALLEQLELRIVAKRLLDLAACPRQLERDEVVALEEADEVRGADDQRAVDQLHRSQRYRPARSGCLSRGR